MPSSRFLSEDVARAFERFRDKSALQNLRILEIGPGTGSFTKAIVPLLRESDRLDVVEQNPYFYAMLSTQFINDKIRLFHDDILNFQPDCGSYDFVISSIPYEAVPSDICEKIWQKKLELCRPDAQIIYYKYLNFRRFRCAYEREVVKRYQTDDKIVYLNVPPARIRILTLH